MFLVTGTCEARAYSQPSKSVDFWDYTRDFSKLLHSLFLPKNTLKDFLPLLLSQAKKAPTRFASRICKIICSCLRSFHSNDCQVYLVYYRKCLFWMCLFNI